LGETSLAASIEHGYFRSVAGFFLGVLTYQIFPYWSRLVGDGGNRFMYLIFLPGTLVGIVVFQSLKTEGYSDFALLPLVVLLILAVTSTSKGPVTVLLNLKPMVWIGKISYSIYMVHAAVIWVLVQVLRILDTPTIQVDTLQVPNNGLLNPSAAVGFLFFGILIVILLFSSHFTYKWIEAPFRRKSRELADQFRWTQSTVNQSSA
jgi:peptidoglycan/LPS O-acetylase OafA/YrhL